MNRTGLGVLILSLCLPLFAETNSVELRIQQSGAPTSGNTISVNPNQQLDLSADLWGVGGQCTEPGGCAQNRGASDFLWSSDDRPNTVCDPYNASECSAETDFHVTPSGVQFTVPAGSGQPITVSARERAGDLMGSVSLNLQTPVVEEAPPTPPAQIVVLQKTGHWVVIDGVSYWSPNSYRPDWVPYQHGHWVFVAGEGWTWVSYDPWGAYTDHYGIWRLHATHGWIWLPFEHPVYHPCTVTFFFSAGHIGWSPYYSGWPGGYRAGEAAGFRDGFHAGMTASATPPGATVVVAHNFYAQNIFKAQVARTEVPNIYRAAVTSRSFGPQPGGMTPQSSRTWINNQVKVRESNFPQTGARNIRGPEANFRTPVPFHPTPKEYPPSRFTTLPQPMRNSGIRKPRPMKTSPMKPRAAGWPRSGLNRVF